MTVGSKTLSKALADLTWDHKQKASQWNPASLSWSNWTIKVNNLKLGVKMYLVPPILVAIPGVGNTTITFSHYPSLAIFCPCSQLHLLKFSKNHLNYAWPFNIGSNNMYPLTTKQGFLLCALKIQIGRISYSCMHGFISAKLDMFPCQFIPDKYSLHKSKIWCLSILNQIQMHLQVCSISSISP